ncbi:DotH/IcmK family type IV secretion protein [Vibrio harveyi]|uniref:DotH/IcmK family type IV secretion protein n=1 Tax=Vibrio harveyi TaxID=669 RepID=UPI00247FEFCE|nr:DotH/IcmK family type IV secretion protein [Vibrio harveyi]
MTALKLALSACFVMQAHAAVTIVGYNSNTITPIDQLEGESPSVDANTLQSFDRNEVKKQLFAKYHSVENMVLYSEKMPEIERSVVQELAMQLVREQNTRIAEEKRTSKIEALQDEIKTQDAEYRELNNPDVIIQRRKHNAKVTEAEKSQVYQSTIEIETIKFDPSSAGQIELNNRVNRPSVISFFDTTGHPYTISSYFPTDTKIFELVKKGDNQLLISAKSDFETLSGFIFLENEPQAIPVLFTSNPKKPLDVKRNVILPSIAPSNTADVEVSVVPLANLNKEDDPVMYRILHGLPTKAKELRQNGLPRDSSVFRYGDFIYIRTRQEMKYDIDSAINIRGLYVYKAYPRSFYWFNVDNREVRVDVYE